MLALGASQPASAALKIVSVFVGGTPPPATNVIGEGNLPELFQVAAESWERVFKRGGGNWTVTIYFGWTNLSGLQHATEASLFAQEFFLAQGGNPVRMTHSLVLFNNKPPLDSTFQNLFMDPTPRDNLKFLRYTTDRVNVDVGGQLNVGRIFSDDLEAANRLDVLSFAMHEIGHSLGLDYSYSGFQDQFVQNLYVEVTPPRPYAGLKITISNGPHIDIGPTALMEQFQTMAGLRKLISAADALLVAQVNSFDKPDLDGLFWETNP